MFRKLSLCLIALFSISLFGCSTATRFGYNHLDWFAKREIGKYIDLTDAQEDWLDPRFDELWAWHRKTQLPLYAVDLNDLADQLLEPVTVEQLDATFKLFQTRADAVLNRAHPITAGLLAQLSDEQVDEMFKEIRENDEEYAEEIAEDSAEERREKSAKRLRKWLKKRMGRLSDAQEALVDVWAEERHDLSADNIANNKRWREAFAAAMARRADPDFSEQVRPLFADPDYTHTVDYTARIEHNEAVWARTIVQISAISTDKQRQEFSDWAREYAEDFAILAQQDP